MVGLRFGRGLEEVWEILAVPMSAARFRLLLLLWVGRVWVGGWVGKWVGEWVLYTHARHSSIHFSQ